MQITKPIVVLVCPLVLAQVGIERFTVALRASVVRSSLNLARDHRPLVAVLLV